MDGRKGFSGRVFAAFVTVVVLVPLLAAVALFAVARSRSPSAGDLLTRTHALANRHRVTWVPLGAIALGFREAVVATEDERFYQHSGVDLIALLRAVPFDLTHLSFAQGASTITEQLAKLIYLDGSDHSAIRKAEEIVLGYRIGHRYDRETVLDAYLNSVYLGEGRFGIENASRHYFATDARRLTLSQASLLAGLIQAPALYDPAVNPSAARFRQLAVLRSMVRNGFATQAEARTALAHTLALSSGVTLPAITNARFDPGSTFDTLELAAALVMLLLAVLAAITTRSNRSVLTARVILRVVAVVLAVGSMLTAAHSVRVI